MAQKVIDVSEHQKTIDWIRVKKTGYHAIIRMGLRGSVKSNKEFYGKLRYDNYFKQNLDGVTKNAIPYTVYFFPTAITDEEAVEEAAWIIEKVKQHNLNLSMPLWLDTETTDSGKGRADKLSRDKRTHLLRIITDHLKAEGIPCGIYSYRNWLNNNLDMSKFDEDVQKNTWVAENPTLTYTGKACLWQYGKTSVPGITGKCDISNVLAAFDMSARKTVKEEKKEEPVAYYRSIVVNTAKAYLGAATGSAKHKEIINKYNSQKSLPRGVRLSYTNAWCAAFVSAVAMMCGYTAIIPTECSCGFMVDKAKKMGIWQEKDTYTPKPGDILMYDWDDNGKDDCTGWPDHTGFVESVNGNTFTTIEGNSGNGAGIVRRQNVKVNQAKIRGFICPKYTADAPPAAKKVSLTINLPEIHLGDKGEHVKLWQYLIGIDQTGVYDEAAMAATKTWQKKNGKKVDGWVGKGCWTKAYQLKGWM